MLVISVEYCFSQPLTITTVVYWVVAYLRVCRVRRAEGQDEC